MPLRRLVVWIDGFWKDPSLRRRRGLNGSENPPERLVHLGVGDNAGSDFRLMTRQRSIGCNLNGRGIVRCTPAACRIEHLATESGRNIVATLDRQLEKGPGTAEDISDQFHRRDIVQIRWTRSDLPDRRFG
ncbi:hypothetical protein D3C72_1940710 [compost metagenome]